jgi:endonuclease YncB( thermonuclease family)
MMLRAADLRLGAAIAAAILLVLQPSRAAAAESLAGPIEARVLEVLDGDSLRVIVHVWLGQHIETLVRIRGIDAPERRGRCAGEIAAAAEATATLGRLVGSGPVILHRVAGDKYFGRVLADVTSDAGVELAPAMLAGGFARAYDGAGARRGWCDKAAQPPETVLGTVR